MIKNDGSVVQMDLSPDEIKSMKEIMGVEHVDVYASITDAPKDGVWVEIPGDDGHHYVSWDDDEGAWRSMTFRMNAGKVIGRYIDDDYKGTVQ